MPHPSSTTSPTSAQLGQELSTWTLLFHQAISEQLGLSAGDHKLLGCLLRDELVTAGDLAQYTGLTTGAITGAIDRLERAGFVRREPDSQDRRRVIVRPQPEKLVKVQQLFAPLRHAVEQLDQRYTPEQLELIHRYLVESIAVMKTETQRLHPAA